MKSSRAFVCVCLLGFVALLFNSKWQPKYYLSIGAIFHNEARFLPEWIEYHRLLGVQHFYLFNHLSEDDYKAALQPYVDEGVVELYDWPFSGKNQDEWTKIQCKAYMKLLRDKKKETFWLAIIDTDEFIAPTNAESLPVFLKPYEPFGGIVINWQLFGTSNVERIPPGKTIIGSLTRRAPKDYGTNRYVKSIVQPHKVKKMPQPHYCRYKHPYFHVGENFARLLPSSLTPTVNVERIRIQHYTYRDLDFFRNEKLKRYAAWYPNEPPVHHPSYDEEEDTSLQAIAHKIEHLLSKS